MREIISGRLAKLIDKYTIEELGIPSLRLMDRAAQYVFERAAELAEDRGLGKDLNISVLAGAGNNGADGILAAVKLIRAGYGNTEVFFCGNEEKAGEEFRVQRAELEALGKRLKPFGELEGQRAELLIDALFGIGLRREVSGDHRAAIELINAKKRAEGASVVAVDIPSGINSDTGRAMCPEAVKADITVTFGFGKTGLYIGEGRRCTGKLYIEDIGYPENIAESSGFESFLRALEGESIDLGRERLFALEASDIKERGLSDRNVMSSKSDYGKLIELSGSKGMAGAAFLSGLAAYKCGAGMVKYLGPEENRSIIQTLLPEAMYDSLGEEDKVSGESISEHFKGAVEWARGGGCVVLGPGLGRSSYAKAVTETAIKMLKAHNDAQTGRKIFLVADGDALWVLSQKRELLSMMRGFGAVTPHVGEMSRLTGRSIEEIKADPVGIAVEFFNDTGINIILKDYVSIIVESKDKIYINISGSPALSKAGSGDVLTGIAAALIMRNNSVGQALSEAAFIHGEAGRRASETCGLNGVLARETASAAALVMGGM